MNKKKYIFLLIFILTVSFLSYCFFPIISYTDKNSPGRILLFDRNWIKITDKPNKFWYKIKLKEGDFKKIEKSEFVKSLIKIEDKNYYNHFWVNIFSKFRAIKDNILWKQISWASTITEQLIKNKYFLQYKRTYLQKLREATLAIYFSFIYSKNEILKKYLDSLYLWNNLYWLKTASYVYFNKENINNLTHEEITLLISLIHNPWIKNINEQSFFNYFKKVKKRLWYNFNKKIKKLNSFKSLDKFPFVTNNNIKTIDSNLQEYTKEVINNTLDELKIKNVTNAAVFAIIPKSWEVLVYQWSRDFNSKEIDGQVNVIKALRQPWSTMKPFLYLQALNNWFWTESLILDIESEYNSFKQNSTYISENYSLKEYWLVRLKKALWNSFNNATVRLARELWLSKVYNFYKKYWFDLKYDFEHYWYSLVLWNPNISLENLVFSYSKLLPSSQPSSFKVKEQWNLEQNKFLLYDILSDPDNRDISFWVNSILNTSIFQAVKTWTSSDFRDNLVISYHPDLVLWVWVWNNDNSSMKWVTWITWAWYIWHQIIEKAISLGYIKDREIEIPKWIVEDYYCLDYDCFSRELIYKKEAENYFSRLKNNYYSREDIKENLSDFEKQKLSELGFEIRE